MEMKQIRYFVAVAESGNVTRAAERLSITQPAVTRQIQALERELGVALFERKNQRLALTFAGEVFLSQARQLLGQVVQTNLVMDGIARGAMGILRIAAGTIPLRYTVLPAAARFREKWPQFHIQLTEAGHGSAITRLEDGRIDLALGIPPTNNQRLAFERLYSPRLYGLVAESHPLVEREFVSVQELANEHLLVLRASQQTNRLYEEMLLNLPGLRFQSVFESDLTDTILLAAEIGLGVAVMADSVLFDNFRLRAIPILEADRQMDFTVCVAWNKDRGLSEMSQAFVQILREMAAERRTDGYNPWSGSSPLAGFNDSSFI